MSAAGSPAPLLALVIPVGPHEDPTDLADTLDSAATYEDPSTTRVVIVNDGGRQDVAAAARSTYGGADVLDFRGRGRGTLGGLTRLVDLGLRHAAAIPGVDMIVRMDLDSLFIGPGLSEAARSAFRADPGLGMLGSYVHTSTGARRDFRPAADALSRDLHSLSLRHPLWSVNVRRVLRNARSHGYVDGEHVLGAAMVLSQECVRRMGDNGLLPPRGVGGSFMGDDQFLSLAARAVGLRIGDLATGDLPLAVAWRELPKSPADLVAARKAVVHPVKSTALQDGAETRAYFREVRRSSGSTSRPDRLLPAG